MIYLDKEGKFQDTHEHFEKDLEEKCDNVKEELLDWFYDNCSFYTERDYDNLDKVYINSCPKPNEILEELKVIMEDNDLTEEEKEYFVDCNKDTLYNELCECACERECR